MSELFESGQADTVDQGVLMVRNWMDENWSSIQEGGEPGLPPLVAALLSLGRTGGSHHQ